MPDTQRAQCGARKLITVLVPCFNEAENVVPMHDAIAEQFSAHLPEYDYRILFADNHSEDGTRDKLRMLAEQDSRTQVIFNTRNFGQFNSPFHAMTQAEGDALISMCCDFQDPPELIPEFVHAWEEGYKVVCGIKTSSRENPVMYFLRSCYYKIIRKMSDVEQIEHFTGFGLYDRSFLNTLRDLGDPKPFLRGIVAELGPAERKDITYEQAERRAGKTHNNWFTLYDAAMLSFTSYTKNGLRIATVIGAVLGCLSLVAALVYFILKLIWWDTFPAGMIPVLLAVLVLGSMQLFFIGLLGEYVLSMNERIMNRPLVIEEERLNFGEKAEDA